MHVWRIVGAGSCPVVMTQWWKHWYLKPGTLGSIHSDCWHIYFPPFCLISKHTYWLALYICKQPVAAKFKTTPHWSICPPVAQRAQRNPFHMCKKVARELDQLEQQGIIEKVDSPMLWVSPLVITPKKSGDVRICIDMRMANRGMSSYTNHRWSDPHLEWSNCVLQVGPQRASLIHSTELWHKFC